MKTLSGLTKQEYCILELVTKGWRNAKIAAELFISPRTVETHLYHIFEKLGVSSRTEAALIMLQMNMIENSKIRGISQDHPTYNQYTRDMS